MWFSPYFKVAEKLAYSRHQKIIKSKKVIALNP